MDDGSLIALAAVVAFLMFLAFFGRMIFEPYYPDDTPEPPREARNRVYVYDVYDVAEGEYSIGDAPVALLEAHDA